MKLVFLENRYKTILMDAIAKKMAGKAEIHWIVQNPLFRPENGKTHVLAFPRKKEVEIQSEITIDHVIESDRQINFFGQKDQNYFHMYSNQIGRIITMIQPTAVFGESTAFHELLTIEWCKKLKIPYLNPSTCRYPAGRFSFYNEDSLKPVAGEGKTLPPEETRTIIDSIVRRKAKPDYMKKVESNRKKEWADKLLKIRSFIIGEKYNTPNPMVKFRLERRKKNLIKEWDAHSVKEIRTNKKFKVLYPLQMQPEANLDVWGRKWRDQSSLIRALGEQTGLGVDLYIKPNPKSKYEISEHLIELINQEPQIHRLHHQSDMKEILDNVDLVVTVTGTVAIECILSGIPVVTLVKTLNNEQNSCRYLEDLESLPEVIKEIEDGVFPKSSDSDLDNFISKLNQTSYKGIISDPFSDPKCMNSENISDLFHAMNEVLDYLNAKQVT